MSKEVYMLLSQFLHNNKTASNKHANIRFRNCMYAVYLRLNKPMFTTTKI